MGVHVILQGNSIREPALFDHLKDLMHRLTDNSLLADLLEPVERALARVRHPAVGRTPCMGDFIALGVLRQLQGMASLREQVQSLLHLDPAMATRGPRARSTGRDALASPSRQAVLRERLAALVGEAEAVLPHRLAGIDGLVDRPVRAIDATYQVESAPVRCCTPEEGGEDNPRVMPCWGSIPSAWARHRRPGWRGDPLSP